MNGRLDRLRRSSGPHRKKASLASWGIGLKDDIAHFKPISRRFSRSMRVNLRNLNKLSAFFWRQEDNFYLFAHKAVMY